jgi:hypothetical protein
VLLLFGLGLARTNSTHFRLITIGGSAYSGELGAASWNDLKTVDSAQQRGVIQADTQINLFYDGLPVRGDLVGGENENPKYRRSFVDDSATVPRIAAVCQWLSSVVGPEDITRFILDGHGNHEGSHSYFFLEAGSNDLWDTTLARLLCPIQGYKIVVIKSCWADPGFANELHAQLHDSVVVITAAGPNGESPTMSDNIEAPGETLVAGSEIDSSPPYLCSFHSEFSDKENKVLCGGVDPTWLRTPGGNAPGFWMDSIDLNRDDRISVAEESAFVWRFDTRGPANGCGWEDPQTHDFTGLKNVFVVWPKHEIIDSVDGQPLDMAAPETVASGQFILDFDLKNNGIYATRIPVEIWLGESCYFDTSSQVGPNHEGIISFSCRDTNVGWLQVRCVTQLNGDQSPENDTLHDSIYLLPAGLTEVRSILINKGQTPTVESASDLAQAAASGTMLFDVTGRRVRCRTRPGVFFLVNDDLGKTRKVIVVR